MAIIRTSGHTKSDSNEELRAKRRKIIEEERIRVLGDALLAFYDLITKHYDVIEHIDEDILVENIKKIDREKIEELAREYASTKPIGY